MSTTEPATRSPFHAGEQAVQQRLGVRESIEPWARQVVRPYLPQQHRAFYAGLPFVVAAARDAAGRAWATLLAAEPGFIQTPDERTLQIAAVPGAGDALQGALGTGADLGLLGIEFASRRRNRVNGRVQASQGDMIRMRVEQAFGNCPQYISPRQWFPVEPAPSVEAEHGLSAAARDWIERADTFFLASGHRGDGENPAYGMDASHRGGPPGFVTVEDERTLVFPDYAGNNHFNTLGNLLLDPRVGLLFVDFEQGSLLQLSGRAQIDWGSPAVARHTGAARLVRVSVDAVVVLRHTLPLRWSGGRQGLRSLRVAARTVESRDVTSFELESRDGSALPGFTAGQHLPVEVTLPGERAGLARSYSLSGASDGKRFRISVKREPRGQVSRHLHDHLEVGDLLLAGAPSGDFVLTSGERPVVLLSAGVGITPMMSMLTALGTSGDPRSVWFVHGARCGAEHAFRDAVRACARGHDNIHVHVAYSLPAHTDVQGRHFDTRGRLSAGLVAHLLPDLDADFYVCGAPQFLAELSTGLQQLGVPEARISFERFGA